MNKSIKLPLFLGAVCLISSAALALVNAWTAPIIATREADARNRGYLEVLGLETSAGYQVSDLIMATGTLQTSGIASYVTFHLESDQSLYAIVYNGEATGWEAGIKFQAGIAAGKFTGYNNIANNETPLIGGTLINAFDTIIAGVTADETSLNAAINTYIAANVIGATANHAGATRSGLSTALLAAASHYLTMEAQA